jgi:hypothetical protein
MVITRGTSASSGGSDKIFFNSNMAQVEYLVVAGGGRGGSESPDVTAAPTGGFDVSS